ncbi:MAG: hypothetical protein M1825_004411 [Sarcosagium campestre]|nr:MAG: hypothetical protein M1825_004411 [Sarcosagium campestre]
MAESSIATPGSGTESTPAKTPALKDKECPYCHQQFTSSSLGRHLDLYVREKNPKPSDGIHHVDEIRQLRCGITRRQARTSSGKRRSSTPNRSRHSSMARQRSPSSRPPEMPELHIDRVRAGINQPNWQTTGVMTDVHNLPNHSSPRSEEYRDLQRRSSLKAEMQKKLKFKEAMQNGRAAELALREVLDSVRAATARAKRSSTLDFDAFTLTFPALVLQSLSEPPTLFSTQPFPVYGSWSLEPPGLVQYEAVRRHVSDRFDKHHKDKGRQNTNGVSGTNGAEPKNGVTNGVDPTLVGDEEDRVLAHVSDAFNHWKTIPERQKQETWQLEILRSLSREREKRKRSEMQLEMANLEIEHCRAQVERMSNLQQPREFLRQTPASLPIAKEAVREVQSEPGASLEWDYDRVLGKWKEVVQGTRQTGLGLSAQRQLSGAPYNGQGEAPMLGSPTVNGDFGAGDGFEEPDEGPHALLGRDLLDPGLHAGAGAMDIDSVPVPIPVPPKPSPSRLKQKPDRDYQFVTMNGDKATT